MTICKYYQNGNCKYGDQCKYEHIDANGRGGGGGGGGGGGNGGQFDPFNPSPSNNNKRPSGRGPGGRRAGPTRDTPQWPLTSVGAHPLSSGNTVTGDLSQEELRARAYAAAPQQRGCTDDVLRSEQALVADHQQRNNNRAPSSSAPSARQQQHSVVDPFASAGAPSGPAVSQQPIFGNVSSAPGTSAHNTPIFPSSNAPPAPAMGFNASGMGGVSPQQPFQQSQAMAAPPQQAANPANPESFSQPAFAFQQVPETAPSYQ